eukprot:scaffold5598_cov89-Amphora_coffeaeformis.AAC.2
MQLIQKLYQPEDQSMPDFDGHPTSGLPCLLACNSVQLKCAIPLCEACELPRARKRPTGATTKTPVPETSNSIRADDLVPGETVSVDQYESSVRGRHLETKGLEREDRKYCGGILFYDHASGRKLFGRHGKPKDCRYICDVKMCKLEFMSYVTLLSFVVISYWDCSLELDCRSVNKWGYPCERI